MCANHAHFHTPVLEAQLHSSVNISLEVFILPLVNMYTKACDALLCKKAPEGTSEIIICWQPFNYQNWLARGWLVLAGYPC